jgi:Na+/melibiose symporter-like transporter
MGQRVGVGDDVRNARVYLIGLAASLIGDSAMTLVSGIWVKSLTGSSSAAAWVSVFIYAPTLLGPAAGMVADRVRRRTLLLVVNGAAAAVMPLLLFVHSAGQVWLIYLVMLGYGLSLTLIDPAENALFAVMLPGPVRQRFNGIRLAIQEGGKLVAPLAGAGLFAVLGGGPVAAVDAATFAFAAFMITRLRVSEPPPLPVERHWRTELTAGFAHIRRVPALRALVLAGALAMVISGIASAARYSLVDALHRSPSFLGLLAGALGAGSVIAGLISGRMIQRFGERRLALLGLLNGVLGNLLQLIGSIPTALAGSFVAGFALPWTVLAVINLSQRSTPDALQGRVAAALTLALFAPQPLAHLAGAFAVSHASFRLLYLMSAALTLATAIWLLTRRSAS